MNGSSVNSVADYPMAGPMAAAIHPVGANHPAGTDREEGLGSYWEVAVYKSRQRTAQR